MEDWSILSDHIKYVKHDDELKSNHLPVLKQKSVDGDQIAPSAKTTKKEGWGGDCQKQLQQQLQPQQKVQMTQAQCPQTLSYQKLQSFQKFDWKTPDGWYPSQSKLHKKWKEEMERLNAKYNLDCFSESELDSESNEEEQYKYDHGYETLI